METKLVLEEKLPLGFTHSDYFVLKSWSLLLNVISVSSLTPFPRLEYLFIQSVSVILRGTVWLPGNSIRPTLGFILSNS